MIVIGGNGGGTISDAGSVVEVEPVGAEVVAGTVVVVVGATGLAPALEEAAPVPAALTDRKSVV